jgi:hypothetical protein
VIPGQALPLILPQKVAKGSKRRHFHREIREIREQRPLCFRVWAWREETNAKTQRRRDAKEEKTFAPSQCYFRELRILDKIFRTVFPNDT